MSANSFTDSSSPKRFRPNSISPIGTAGPEDPIGRIGGGQKSAGSPFRGREIHHFDGASRQNDCVVDGTHSGRHLFSSPQYAIAAVTTTNDTELLNGDSGFQELNIPDELSLDVNENNLSNSATRVSEPPTGDAAQPGQASPELDDADSNISEISCVSDISNISGEHWKPVNEHLKWVEKQMKNGSDPRDILRIMMDSEIDEDIDELSAWRIIVRLLSEPTLRPKLSTVNTIDDVISLIQKSSKIIVLTGAGVSVSCGIPDFRSRNGIYARLSKDYPDLPDPQSMFDIHYFKRNPHPFFKFAKEIYPGQFLPSPSHKFIKFIETKGKLLRNYSQNIDTLEKGAGIERVITCHGSFATASCTNCGYKVDSNAIKSDIFAQRIPVCNRCPNEASPIDNSLISVMKPDIVFFGEGLSDEFHNSMTIDKDECDLLIVIGSSLKVRPVALIPNAIPNEIPQILINREPLNHLNFDVELLGDCDIIIRQLCERLGQDWTDFCFSERTELNQINDDDFRFTPTSRYIFKGAELHDSERESSSSSTSDSEDEKNFSETENNSIMDESNSTTNDEQNESQKSDDLLYKKSAVFGEYFAGTQYHHHHHHHIEAINENKMINNYVEATTEASEVTVASTENDSSVEIRCLKRKNIETYALEY